MRHFGLALVVLTAAAQAQAPPVETEDDSWCLYETAPTLIGGVAALQAATVYPEAARAEGVQGRVLVQFVVQADGTVTDIEAIRSPDPRLTEAALAAVRAVRFEPGQHRGRPIAVRFTVPVTFRLAGDDQR